MDIEDSSIVEIKHLWKVFGKSDKGLNIKDTDELEKAEENGAVCAVRDVSFTINKGEVFVIMGLSGSGKSTLIRCLPRLVEPSAGEIRINDENVSEMNEEKLTEFRRTKTAMVFQHYGLLPHRTVLQNVSFGLKLRGVDKVEREEKARQVIEKVGLKSWEKHYPSQLSGGMQQRVGIARALVQDTDLLLLDEPFSGLDPLIRREMQDELVRLQTEFHKTMIFVTHDLNEALRLGDRMAVMKKGVFVQIGSPQEIVRRPADEYVQRFVQDEQRIALMVESNEKSSNVCSLEKHTSGKAEKIAVGRR